MNRERARTLLPIIQAFAEGGDIQFRLDGREWLDLPKSEELTMTFPAMDYEYRIKPEPREFWIFKPNMRAYEDRQIGPNPEDDDEYFKVREVIE